MRGGNGDSDVDVSEGVGIGGVNVTAGVDCLKCVAVACSLWRL